MSVLLAHDDHQASGDGTFLGSGLYDVSAVHAWGLAVLIAFPVVAFIAWRWRDRLPRGFVGRLRLLSPERQVAVAALTLSAAVHAAIVPAHGWSAESLLFAVDAALLTWAAWLLLTRRRGAAAVASAALLGSLIGLALSASAGETPDQVAMLTKVVEVTALVALWAPMAAGRRGRVLGTVGVSVIAALVAVPVWTAALSGHTDDESNGAHGDAASLAATPAEQAAADQLHAQTVEALAKYADPAVAVADGYAVDGVRGQDFHAPHATYGEDGRIFDPERPEHLVYAESDRGPLLLGAMFETESVADAGPQVGGPLTVWHRHEQVCFTVLPPTVAGMTSPYGVCPLGSVAVPWTGEMIHVWTAPGAPSQFGDMPEEWRAAYVAGER